MNYENLRHYEPTEYQYYKFKRINDMSSDDWEKHCVFTNDCSICDMAIHQQLITTEKHICAYGLSKKAFEGYMDNADIDF